MEGTLYIYRKRLSAFEFSSDVKTSCAVVFIGGLTDGLLSAPYLLPLHRALKEDKRATLVQPLLSSSYGGFGTASLDTDAKELLDLLRYLTANRGFERFVLIGHSTGCQDIVHFFRKYGDTPEASSVYGAVLQGPVSDRECMRYAPQDGEPQVSDALLAKVEKMIQEGNGKMPVSDWLCYGRYPISADRLWSLCGKKLTLDDMFSSDLTDEELKEALKLPAAGKWPERVIVAQSMNDEYIPPYVDRVKLAGRISAAIPGSEVLLVPDVHAVESEKGINAIIAAVTNILPK